MSEGRGRVGMGSPGWGCVRVWVRVAQQAMGEEVLFEVTIASRSIPLARHLVRVRAKGRVRGRDSGRDTGSGRSRGSGRGRGRGRVGVAVRGGLRLALGEGVGFRPRVAG